ncbi:MAG: PorV/PorQ family protein [Elusimicrobia bacterium]|nr:PorV/PorQ family protein [Elusimicrobiota bacterium]
MRSLSLLITAALVLVSSPISAAGPGTSAASFLNLGFGARPLGIGEAFVGMADDVSALHYNPAGLAFDPGQAARQTTRRYEMLASHAMHIQDIRLSQFGFLARPWGMSVTHLGLDGIERRTTETAAPEGTFGASDLMLGFSYGKRLTGTAVGLGFTGKFIRQTIGEYSATAYAADMGALYRLRVLPLSLGASVVNLGTKVTFLDQGYPLPLTLRLGGAYGMTAKFPHALSFQLDLPRDNSPAFRLGFEYLGFGPFALRAGYRTTTSAQRTAALGKALGSTAPGLAEFYGMFMGMGFRSKFGNMDYTLLPYGELGNAHRVSFTLRFGGQKVGPLAGPAAAPNGGGAR